MVETDWHYAGPEMDERMAEIIKYISWAKNWKVEETVNKIYSNFSKFMA